MGNTEQLKKVQEIAKKLKLAKPGLKHTEAVKQAWKQIKAVKK